METRKDYNPDEPRDAEGRWTTGGDQGATDAPSEPQPTDALFQWVDFDAFTTQAQAVADADNEKFDAEESAWASGNHALQDLLRDGDLSIRMTPQSLDRVIEDEKIKSLRETRTNFMGIPSEKYFEARWAMEGKTFGHRADPIYGYLAHPNERGLGQLDNLSTLQYGGLQVVLKREVRERATVTLGDSLNNYGYQEHGWVENAVAPVMLEKPTVHMLRGLMASISPSEGADALNMKVEHLSNVEALVDAGRGEGFSDEYLEAQIHGGLSLSDLAEVVDSDHLLSEETKDRLVNAGVSVSNPRRNEYRWGKGTE